MDLFDDTPFEYNREYPPLFFVRHEDEEECMHAVAREYFRLGTQRGASHMTTLSNGMTLGEYAMNLCLYRNQKRKVSLLKPVSTKDVSNGK